MCFRVSFVHCHGHGYFLMHMINITACRACLDHEGPTRHILIIDIFILQARVDKSIEETPSQQEDKLERKVSRNKKTTCHDIYVKFLINFALKREPQLQYIYELIHTTVW